MSNILNERLPHIELSYGNKLHKKVHADVYQILPKGKKCLVWYTYWNEHNVCYLLHLGNNGEHIERVEKTKATFSDELCYGKGTIVSGIWFTQNRVKTFALLDVHFYKGRDTQLHAYHTKLELLYDFFQNIKQDIYTTSQLLVALPVITQNYTEALDIAKTVPYKVYAIQLNRYDKSKCIGFHIYNTVHSVAPEAIFKIVPQLTCDMYGLYTLSSDKIHCYAAITDYKTSLMMNNIFRNIKENKNLDLLEESDDESDFENINPEKYVYLNKSTVMRCVYIPRFNRWKPISLCATEIKPTSMQEVMVIEKKYNSNIYDKSRKLSKPI